MSLVGDQRPRYYAAQTGDVRICAVDGATAVASSLAPELRRLLVAQADEAGKHQYQFFDGHVPLAGKIYVEQRVEASPAALVTGEAGIPGLLTVREVLNRPTEFANVLLVGGPGMGKSTVISQIVREQSAWLLGEDAAPDTVPCMLDAAPETVPAADEVTSDVVPMIRSLKPPIAFLVPSTRRSTTRFGDTLSVSASTSEPSSFLVCSISRLSWSDSSPTGRPPSAFRRSARAWD